MKQTLDEIRNTLLNGATGVGFTLSHPIRDAQACNGLAPCARAFLNEAIRCLAVGLPEFVAPLAEKAREFLEVSLQIGEIPNGYFVGLSESDRIIHHCFTRILVDKSLAIPCPSEMLPWLRQVPAEQLDHHYCYYLVAGHPDSVASRTDLSVANPHRIRHVDRFAHYVANNRVATSESESVIAGFLDHYARICVGVASGLGTPIDLLTAASAVSATQDGKLSSTSIWMLLERSMKGL